MDFQLTSVVKNVYFVGIQKCVSKITSKLSKPWGEIFKKLNSFAK